VGYGQGRILINLLTDDPCDSTSVPSDLQRAQGGRGSDFDAELRENYKDAFFYDGFAVAANGCDLAVCLALG
jgi:hypothetical protein